VVFYYTERGDDMAGYDGTIRIGTEIDVSDIEKGISNLTGGLKGIGSLVADLLATTVNLGTAFEDSMAEISLKTEGTGGNIDNFSDKIMQLSNSTGIASTEIADALSQALSSGVPATEDMGTAMQFMQQSALLATASCSDIGSVVDTTTSVLNAYGLGLENTASVQNTLYQLQEKSGESLGKLGSSLATVTPMASALGVSFDEVGAALSTMSAQGTSTSDATSQLNTLLGELSTKGSLASESLAVATEKAFGSSKSFQELQDEGKSVSDIMQILSDYAADTGLSMYDLIGSQKSVSAALQLSGENATTYRDNLAEIKKETDAVAKAAEKNGGTVDQQFNKVINEGKNTLISFYEDGIKPAVVKMGEFVDFLSKHRTLLGELGIAFGALSALIVAYKLKLMLASKQTTLWKLVSGKAVTSTKDLGNAFKLMTTTGMGPAILIIAAVAAAAYLIYKNWDKIKPILLAIWNAIKEAALVVWGGIKEFFIGLWDGLTDIFSTVWEVISSVLSTVWNGIVLAATTIWGALVTFFTNLWNGIQLVISTVWGVISSVLSTVWDSIVLVATTIWGELVTFFTDLWNNLILAATTIWTGLSTFFSELWTIITEAVTIAWTAIKEFFSELWTGISTAAGTAWQGVQTVWSTVAAWFTDNVINPLLATFGNLKNGIIQIWNDIWKGIKTVINDYILSGIEAFINGIISGVNSLIEALNRLKISVPNWVTKLTGISSFGFSLKPIDAVSVPRLAQGAVIPPNRQFLAVLGDQKSGVNIETPLDTMVEAFKAAIGEMGLGGSASTDVHISYEGSLAKLAQVLQPHITAETSRRGIKAVKVGSLA